jgi:hypothetical protein
VSKVIEGQLSSVFKINGIKWLYFDRMEANPLTCEWRSFLKIGSYPLPPPLHILGNYEGYTHFYYTINLAYKDAPLYPDRFILKSSIDWNLFSKSSTRFVVNLWYIFVISQLKDLFNIQFSTIWRLILTLIFMTQLQLLKGSHPVFYFLSTHQNSTFFIVYLLLKARGHSLAIIDQVSLKNVCTRRDLYGQNYVLLNIIYCWWLNRKC